MTNYKALYQEVILDHNKRPRNYGTLEHASHRAVGHNPLCGDHISVALNLDRESIDGIAFQGESCAICKASASMMTAAIKGKSRTEAEILIQEFLAMATGKLDLDSPNQIGRLEVFAGVRDLPTRVKCAILPWHTLQAAFNTVASISTETEAHPMHAPNGNA
ncbi:MAG: nitrogen fixation NifU-like protein [Candidatus Azotimanducaceae bacterium]|jgi:nitrogen fixation NifU-like protein